jgi:biopolymer transport protein ExbB
MRGDCLNPYGCQWSIGYLWRWMTWIGHVDVFLLALLLGYVVAVFAYVSFCYFLARRAREMDTDSQSRRKLVSDLRIEVSSLKSIAFIAPYLGLGGTCLGLLNLFRGIGMERHAVIALMAVQAAAALVTTGAGILVAVPATCFYNHLCTLIEWLPSETSDEVLVQRNRHCQPRRFPLAKRFSELPAFALIAAPGLAILITGYMTFASFHTPVGLGIELASADCESDLPDRPLVLHITDAGRLFLNNEQQKWSSLAGRLSEIYGVRVRPTLYLVAEYGVPFQTVADAIDIAQNIPVGGNPRLLNITVRLITPRAINARCPERLVTPSSQHASR